MGKKIPDEQLIDELSGDESIPADDGIQTYRCTPGQIKSYVLSLLSIATGMLQDACVTTGKIADDAITNDKLAADIVTVVEIADDAVETDKIKDKAVTIEKLDDLNVVVSSANTSQSFSSTTFAAITGLSATVAGIGRPVLLQMQPTESTTVVGGLKFSGAATNQRGEIRFKRNGTVICTHSVGNDQSFGYDSPSSISFIDVNAINGSNVYTAEARHNTGGTLVVLNSVLVAVAL